MEKNIKMLKLNTQSCIIYTRLLNHKFNVETTFKFAEIALIEADKLYYKQLQSTQVLNKDIDWNRKFFDSIENCLSKLRIQRNEEDSFVRIAIIEKQGVPLMKAELKYQVGKDSQRFLFDQYKAYVMQKSNLLLSLKIQNQSQKAVYQQNLVVMQKQQIKNQTSKQNLLLKLSALYVSKKNKLREFQDEDSNFNFSETSEVGPLPDEIDQTMGATFFMQSQNFR